MVTNDAPHDHVTPDRALPPPAAGVHHDLLLSPDALYSHYTVEDLSAHLCNTVSNWKVILELGLWSKASSLIKDVWNGLISYWTKSHSVRIAAVLHFSFDEWWAWTFVNGSHFMPKICHSGVCFYFLGRKERRRAIIAFWDFWATHSQGSLFVDPMSEKIHNGVSAQIAKWPSWCSSLQIGSPSSCPWTKFSEVIYNFMIFYLLLNLFCILIILLFKYFFLFSFTGCP